MKRFWDKVVKSDNSDGCWIWAGAYDFKDGYGFVSFRKKMWFVHRVSWVLENGEIPEGLCVLHRCDVRLCVRPSHLFLGTRKDNNLDCTRKGRREQGEFHHCAKLTAEQAEEIRKKYVPKIYPLRKLAEEYQVSIQSIHSIIKGETWKTGSGTPEMAVSTSG
jgi:hypothetical protein